MSKNLPEELLDFALEWSIRGAELSDSYQARHVHKILYRMLTEAEISKPVWGVVGRYWLTPFGKVILADMHQKLSQSPDKGKALVSSVLAPIFHERL